MLLDINEIQKFLPHRYPFLLIDKVIEMERYKRIVAIKNVTINESFFQGHFPGKPIMPARLTTMPPATRRTPALPAPIMVPRLVTVAAAWASTPV